MVNVFAVALAVSALGGSGEVAMSESPATIADDPCEHLNSLGELRARGLSSPRLLHAARLALEAADLGVPATVCESGSGAGTPPVALSLPIPHSQGISRRVFVVVPRATSARYDIGTLVAHITHELAHAALFDEPSCQAAAGGLRHDTRAHISCELRVDSLAAAWVGVTDMTRALRDARRVARPYIGRDERNRFDDELALRIRALEQKK